MLLLVPDAQTLRKRTSRIAQQWERKEKLIDHGRIVGDGVDADPYDLRVTLFKRMMVPGKADQLPVTVWSPLATVESQHDRPSLEMGREEPGNLPLIRQFKVGHVISGGQVHYSQLLTCRYLQRCRSIRRVC